MIDIDKTAVTIAIADMQTVQRKPQRERIQMHLLHGDRSLQCNAQSTLQLAANQRWCRKKAEQAERHQHDGNDAYCLACPMGSIEFAGWLAPGGGM